MSVQIIDIPKPNCPKAESPTNKGWLSNRSRRTEAHPKQSLFGSSLQMRDEKMIEELKSIDLTAYDQEMKMRGQKNQKLSPELQAIFGPGKYITVLYISDFLLPMELIFRGLPNRPCEQLITVLIYIENN